MTLEDAVVALKRREPLQMDWTIPLYEQIKLHFVRWFRCCKFTENEWMYLKAKNRLAAELDITRLIKNLRTQNNLLKLISSQRELKLVRMQANKNVIMLRESDKHQLLKPLEYKSLSELSKLHGDSSDFETDDFEPYIKDLNVR